MFIGYGKLSTCPARRTNPGHTISLSEMTLASLRWYRVMISFGLSRPLSMAQSTLAKESLEKQAFPSYRFRGPPAETRGASIKRGVIFRSCQVPLANPLRASLYPREYFQLPPIFIHPTFMTLWPLRGPTYSGEGVRSLHECVIWGLIYWSQ